MKVGVTFLQQTFGKTPESCTLGILWAEGPHGPGKFPIIALGYDDWMPEIDRYCERLEQGLAAFDKAIDWAEVPRTATTPLDG